MNPFHFITMQAAQDALRDLGVQPLHSAAIVGRPKRRGVRMPTLVRIVVTICVIGGSLAIASPEALAIVGGAEDPSVLSPYVRLEIATFDAKWERIYEHRCSGTVIAPKWVLTARHCMPMIRDVPYMRVTVVGADGTLMRYTVARMVGALCLRAKCFNDVALLETEETIEGVLVAKYGTLSKKQWTQWRFRQMGYGLTAPYDVRSEEPRESSPVLKYLDVSLKESKWNRPYDRWVFSSPHGTACNGDSGGATLGINPANGETLVIGIAVSVESYGKDNILCKPGYELHVDSLEYYFDWVAQHTGVTGELNHLKDLEDPYGAAQNIAVTQRNVGVTICDKEWSKTRTIPVKELRKAAIAAGLNKSKTHTPMLRLPVNLGGTLANSTVLWVNKTGKYSVKQRVLLEQTLNAMVCSNALTLREVEGIFSGEWTENFHRYVR